MKYLPLLIALVPTVAAAQASGDTVSVVVQEDAQGWHVLSAAAITLSAIFLLT